MMSARRAAYLMCLLVISACGRPDHVGSHADIIIQNAGMEPITVREIRDPSIKKPAVLPETGNTAAQDQQDAQTSTEPLQDVGEMRGQHIKNPSPVLITKMQDALKERGYYFGASDGTLGFETLNALYMYQAANQMETRGVTLETLQALDVAAGGI